MPNKPVELCLCGPCVKRAEKKAAHDARYERWFEIQREKGKQIGRIPCPNRVHWYVSVSRESANTLPYSNPHLVFSGCDGWLSEESEVP